MEWQLIGKNKAEGKRSDVKGEERKGEQEERMTGKGGKRKAEVRKKE